MRKTIEQMKQEATTDKSLYNGAKLAHSYFDEYKFAALIVEECASIAKYHFMLNDAQGNSVEFAIKNLIRVV